MKFPELKPDKSCPSATTWSLRKIGIYHDWHHIGQTNTFILLFPNFTTAFLKRLEDLEYERVRQHPLQLHLLLYETYVDNWRGFLKYQEEDIVEEVLDLTPSWPTLH